MQSHLLGGAGTSSSFRFQESSRYRDVAFVVVFLANLLGCLGLGAYKINELTSDPEWSKNQNSDGSVINERLAFVAAGGTFIAALLSFGWLQLMKIFPKQIIWMALILSGVWILIPFVVAIYYHIYVLAIILGLFLLLHLIYILIVRRRIPFSSAMLKLIVALVQMRPATVLTAVLAVIPVTLFSVFISFALLAIPEREQDQAGGQTTQITNAGYGMMVYMMFSFYWVIGVINNTVHVTCAGTFASWYFGQQGPNPTMAAFKRATTTSFGSICLGSLIVATLKTLRFMFDTASRSIRNQFVVCILRCILDCIINLVRLFNHYAYTYVAIYGLSFIQASKRTWELLESSGFSLVCNENLIGSTCFFSALITGLITSAYGVVTMYFLYENDGSPFTAAHAALAFVVCLIVGFVVAIVVFEPIGSGVSCMFVCFAEDPLQLRNVDPQSFGEISFAYEQRYRKPFIAVQAPPSRV